MAFPPKSSVQSIDDDTPGDSSDDSKAGGPKGPPAASPAPRVASSNSSLYSQAGQSAMQAGQQGLGSEGSNPSIIGVQGLALIQRGVQMLNLAFPENPGLVAILGDIIGRLQTVVPQLVANSSNQMGPQMGLMTQMMTPMGMQQPGMGQPGMPPQGAPGMPPPPMAGPSQPPQGPQGPPMPPLGR